MASKLYLISPPQIDLPKFIEQFKSAIDGGEIAMFQLRLKNCSESEISAAAEKLLPICHSHKIKFLINDSPNIASKTGADGVHIGDEDTGLHDARQSLGRNAIIGVSCYNSLDAAKKAATFGANYVSFGAFYPTTTKVAKSKAELNTLITWKSQSQVPCSAIGGITPQNATPLVKAGADYICVVSYVWNHPESPRQAVKQLALCLAG